MAEVALRRAREGDLPGIVRLWREMWDFHTPLDPRFAATAAANFVMEGWILESIRAERSAVWVAEAAPGELAGYLLAMILENPPVLPWQFYGYVSEISVSRKNQGVGTLLLEAAHEWFREKGLPYAEVNVSVLNPEARAFWRSRGYGEFLERLRIDLQPRNRP